MSSTNAPSLAARLGVVLVDKPVGPTSHDVVRWVRRSLGVRRVGHAGTLDPAASGLLVVMVGPATKLAPYLAAAAKSYRATVQLGVATTTLDAEGDVTETAPLPDWCGEVERLQERLEPVLAAERARTEQQPPVFSAIKVAGRAAYARARAGQPVELSSRPVKVHQLELLVGGAGLTPAGSVELALTVSKGYYVRSLARDLGARLGLPAHLRALRRTTSGPFEVSAAVSFEANDEQLRAGFMSLERAARAALPAAELTEGGNRRACCGQPLGPDDFRRPPPPQDPTAWFAPDGSLTAVGELRSDGRAVVLRGFASPPAD